MSNGYTRRKSESRHLLLMVLIFAVGAVLLLGSCDRLGGGKEADAAAAEGEAGRGGPGAGAEDEAQQTVFAVSTTEAVLGQLKDYIELNGDVVSKTTVQTFPDTAGKLSKLYIDLGDKVRKDQVIADVDPSKPGMKYEASPVKAPISGTVTDLPAQVGSTVSPQMSVAQLSKMESLQIRTDVAERFISAIELGLEAVITSDAYPDRIYSGRVAEVSPVVDPQARMMEVKINFTEGSEGLKAGMFVGVKIITEQKENTVKLPVDCVVQRFGEEYVFVVKDAPEEGEKLVSRRSVTTGIEIDRKIEILDGLEAGEEVVYRGQTLLEEGSKVRVVSQVEPLSSEDVLE